MVERMTEDRGFFSNAQKIIDIIQELILKVDLVTSKLEEAIALMKKEEEE